MRFYDFVRVSAFVFFVACGSGTPVSSSCTSDDQCGSFKCLHDQRLNSDNSCTNVTAPPEGTCSPPCRTHADCTPYGASFKCALSQTNIACNPTGICLDDYHVSCNPGPCREAPAN